MEHCSIKKVLFHEYQFDHIIIGHQIDANKLLSQTEESFGKSATPMMEIADSLTDLREELAAMTNCLDRIPTFHHNLWFYFWVYQRIYPINEILQL